VAAPTVAADYATAGSRVRWAAQGLKSGLITYDTAVAELRDAITEADFYNVVAGGQRIFNFGAYKYAIKMELNLHSDFARLDHVRQRLTQIAQSKGWTMYPAQNSIAFIERAPRGTAPQAGTSPEELKDKDKNKKDDDTFDFDEWMKKYLPNGVSMGILLALGLVAVVALKD